MSKNIKEFKEYMEKVRLELMEFESAYDMLEVLLEYSNELESFDPDNRIEENKVKGCTSNIYISCEKINGSLHFRGESEAIMPRGFLAVFLNAINGLSAKDIIENTRDVVENFVKTTNIKSTLTPTRANAFGNIYEHIVMNAKKNI